MATPVTWVTIRWQSLWQLWVGVVVYLCGARYIFDRAPTTWRETGYVVLAISISALLIALLGLLLRPEPLAVQVDYRAGRVTCYQPKLAWRIRLPLSHVHCQLTEQTSHKGSTHFLIVSGPQGQAWTMQESNGWPLNRLKQLRELLTFDVA